MESDFFIISQSEILIHNNNQPFLNMTEDEDGAATD